VTRVPDVATLILPGLYDSGPDHWQSVWERADPTCRRVVQADWATPRCADWVATLDAAVAAADAPVVLVAHSSSCLTVAHWAGGAGGAAQRLYESVGFRRVPAYRPVEFGETWFYERAL
jgi:predicted alpha/beta hydrolase family esterase